MPGGFDICRIDQKAGRARCNGITTLDGTWSCEDIRALSFRVAARDGACPGSGGDRGHGIRYEVMREWEGWTAPLIARGGGSGSAS